MLQSKENHGIKHVGNDFRWKQKQKRKKKKTEEKGMKTTGDIPQSGYNQKEEEEVIILKRKRMRIVYKSSYWFPRGKRDHK